MENKNEIKEYTIVNGDYRLKFLNLGAVITEYSYKEQNIVLSFEDNNSYLNNSTYMGAVVGRTAGRIKNATIGTWKIPVNFNGKHNLHGNDLHLRYYEVQAKDNSAELKLYDKEGDFPGNANIKIQYTLTDEGLEQIIDAYSDTPTVFNFTNHAYFNLDQTKSILDHNLQIPAQKVGQLDSDLLPINDVSLEGTAFDFNDEKLIRQAYEQGDKQFKYSKFIDHPYKLAGDGNIILKSDKLKLKISTNQDYVVVYCGNYIGEEVNKLKGGMNKDYSAICLETQKRPNDTELVTHYMSKTLYKLTEI